MANEPVEFSADGKPPISGQRTDAQGKFETEVGLEACGGTLKIAGRELSLRFSHLNPIRDTPDQGISGIQARLRNLGYYSGPITDELDKATRVALSIFQHDAGLEVGGKPNAATLDKLAEAYGC